MNTPTDFVIVGGGVVGISIARALRQRHKARVVVLEKEPATALHASGRNSGVLHAGFYYDADSMKARLCRQGNQALTAYCEEKGLSMLRCSKLVVAANEEEGKILPELLKRAQTNGVPLEAISLEDARKIEPRVLAEGGALWSPSTITVSPKEVMAAMTEDALAEGVEIQTGVRVLQRQKPPKGATSEVLRTNRGLMEARFVVNAAGLYADKLAHQWGVGLQYTLIPFRGGYIAANSWAPHTMRTNIYPVPRLDYPFLGTHFTVTVDGVAKVGPTVWPVLWRENYGLGSSGGLNFKLGEMLEQMGLQTRMLLGSGFNFSQLAGKELLKLFRPVLVKQAQAMASDLPPWHQWKVLPAGIRAQLFNRNTGKLQMDFVVEPGERSLHVLNAISPAFTSSMPFAQLVADQVDGLL